RPRRGRAWASSASAIRLATRAARPHPWWLGSPADGSRASYVVGPLGFRAFPDSWRGTPLVFGYVVSTGRQFMSIFGRLVRGFGIFGMEVSTCAKLNALVRSPQVSRRHCDRFGTAVPKRVSRKRNIDVWSKV